MQAELILLNGTRYPIRMGQTFVLGRGMDVSIRLTTNGVSRRHARVELRSDGVYVTDLGSRNGTCIQGVRLVPHMATRVLSGEVIFFCQQLVEVQLIDSATTGRGRTQFGEELKSLFLLQEGGFEVLGRMGSGGYGSVYAVRHPHYDGPIALKLLWSDPAESEEEQRFLREAGVACEILSPYVVRVFGIRLLQGRLCILMELVDGPSALDLLRHGPVPIPDALRIAEHVALGLEAVHAAGVIHRDVKPSNVLLSPAGPAKLCDFGLARPLTASRLTDSGVIMGTLPYLSPEQAAGLRMADFRSDLYALGATLYHLLGGEPPFQPTHPKMILEAVEKGPRPLGKLREDCPPGVARLVHALLEKDPADRPQGAASVARQLHELRQLLFPNPSKSDPAEEDMPTWISSPRK